MLSEGQQQRSVPEEQQHLPIQQESMIEKELITGAKWHAFKEKLRYLIESSVWSVLMTVVTIWTLFQTDLKYGLARKEADSSFEVIISIFFFLFLFEIFAQMVYNPLYFIFPSSWEEMKKSSEEGWFPYLSRLFSFGSFYFWLDLIATASVIFDMKWMIGNAGLQLLNGGGKQSAKGAAAAKTGTRLGRLVRLVRMVRLTRLTKLYKYVKASITGQHIDSTELDDNHPESYVGAVMADLTNRRFVFIVFLLFYFCLFVFAYLFSSL
jgi:hypothetical protein